MNNLPFNKSKWKLMIASTYQCSYECTPSTHMCTYHLRKNLYLDKHLVITHVITHIIDTHPITLNISYSLLDKIYISVSSIDEPSFSPQS